MSKDKRYILIRVFNKKETLQLSTEEIYCETLQEAVDLGSILNEEEKIKGSYIFDNLRHKKLTLKGKE